MKVLVVSKPIYNYCMPLVDYPKNGDVFSIDSTLDSIYGEANIAAYILGKYGIDVSYTGIIGKDEAGEKFKASLEEASVDTKYMEIDYEHKTDIIYSISNTEKVGCSKVKVNSMKSDLNKFKYDFTPDYLVLDDKDFSGANALLNNYPNVVSVFYGDKPNKDTISMCKRSKYVVCNIDFASKVTGEKIELGKPKTIINLYQKIVDLFNSSWIITLGDKGVIYTHDNTVKMIPALKVEAVDTDKAGAIFFSTFAYAIVSGLDIENAVRLANAGASFSLTTFGPISGIMDLNTLMTYKVTSNANVQNNQAVEETQPVPQQPQGVQQVSQATPVAETQPVPQQPQGVQQVSQATPVAETQPVPQQSQSTAQTTQVENSSVVNVQ